MQPLMDRRKLARQGLARAKMYLAKHLGWIPGVPLRAERTGIRWLIAPWDGPGSFTETIIDRQRIRDAEIALTKLRHRFPRALPRVVESHEQWLCSMDQLLSILKAVIHDGAGDRAFRSPPTGRTSSHRWSTRIEQLLQKHCRLEPFLRSVRYLEQQSRKVPTDDFLDWIAMHANDLEKLNDHLPLQLQIASLWRSFTDLSELSPIVGVFEVTRETKDSASATNLLRAVQAWLARAKQYSTDAAQRTTVRFATSICRMYQDVQREPSKKANPDGWCWGGLKGFASAPPEVLASISRFIDAVPKGRTNAFLSLLRSVSRQVRTEITSSKKRKLTDFLDAFAILLRRHHSHPKLNVFLFSPESEGERCHVEVFLHQFIRSDVRLNGRRVVEVIEQLLLDESFSPDEQFWDNLLTLSEATPASNVAVEIMRATHRLHRDLDFPDPSGIRKAIRLTNDFDEIAQLLYVCYHLDWDIKNEWDAIRLAWNDPWLHPSMMSAGSERDVSRLSNRLRQVTAVKTLGGSVSTPSIPTSAAWIDRFPKELRAPLLSLAALTNDAERVAQRILAKDIPDATCDASELRYLQDRLKDDTLEAETALRYRQRVDGLLSRTRSRQSISPRRMDTLRRKLEARRDVEFDRWIESRLVDALVACLPSSDVRVDVSSISCKPMLDVVIGIAHLDSTMRRLGLDLLAKSFQGKECPGVEEPENRTFVDRTTAAGLDWTPWFDDDLRRTIVLSTGETYDLGWTRDPLDYLLMGHHFSTCLSPRSFNFYSTIANAVDINKQVVYGRTRSGQVVGRCLLAITDEGKLKVFHPYRMRKDMRFAEAIRSFALDLAEGMGTHVSIDGNVSMLVTPRWYDDFAEEGFTTYFTSEHDSTSLRNAIRTGTADDVLAQIEQLHRVYDQATIHRLINSMVLEEYRHPGRDVVVREVCGVLSERAEDTLFRLQFAAIAAQLGKEEPLQRICEGLSARDLKRCSRRNTFSLSYCTPLGLFDADAWVRICEQLDPTKVLRFLRSTRRQGVRSDNDETIPLRRQLLASAHRRLGRRSRAKDLIEPEQRRRMMPRH